MTRTTKALALAACLAIDAHAATIAVDVGHYAAAPGATSAYGEAEFGYNLALAETIARRLRRDGHTVLLIGAAGDMDDLKARPAMAARADFFLSIHHDSVNERDLSSWLVNGQSQRYSDMASGYAVFVSPDNPRYAASLACAEAIGGALRDAGREANLYHVKNDAGEGYPVLDVERGLYQAGFAVLRHATIPAVLLEAGVIVNRDEALTLKKPETRSLIANAVAAAIKDCVPATLR